MEKYLLWLMIADKPGTHSSICTVIGTRLDDGSLGVPRAIPPAFKILGFVIFASTIFTLAIDPVIPATGETGEPLPLRAMLAEVERRAIRRALIACGGNRTKTAERLGITRHGLKKRMVRLGLRKAAKS